MAKTTQPKTSQPKTSQTKNSSAPAKPVTQAEVSAKEAPQGASPAAALQDPATSVANLVSTPPAEEGTTREASTAGADPVAGAVATPGLQAAIAAENPDASLTGDGTGNADDELVVEAIIVTSDVEGFRRAGRPWSKSPTTVSIDELSPEQLALIEGEPMLKVVYFASPNTPSAS